MVVWCCVFCYLLFGWVVLFVACWIVLVCIHSFDCFRFLRLFVS